MVKYSIVIPTYNRMYITAAVVNNFLHLLKHRQDFEILVVNDGSTDNTEQSIQAIQLESPRIRLLQTNKKNGEYRNPGFARNTGIQFAQGEIICFCDGDIFHILDPLSAMDRVLQENVKDGFYVTGVYMRSDSQGECTGPHGKGKNIPHGSWLATSKNNLLEIGGYDERFKVYGNEDHDIVQRLERKGLTHISEPTIVGVHPYFDNGRDESRQLEIAQKIQREIQREISIIRNVGKKWGLGREIIFDINRALTKSSLPPSLPPSHNRSCR